MKPADPASAATDAPSLAIDTPRRSWLGSDAATLGICFGLLSAVGYTGTNIALRKVARAGELDWALWVACVKAAPAALGAWVAIAVRTWQGLPVLPPTRLLWPLIVAGLVMQFGGNGMFQFALSLGGLALSVPLTFAALIWSGAVVGRTVLGEPITGRSMVAIALLMVSMLFLSLGAEDAARTLMANPSWLQIAGAVFAAVIAGLSYGTNGVVIRRCVTTDVSVPAMLMVLSTTGVVGLGAVSLAWMGPGALAEVSGEDWATMWIAGTLNAIAFFFVTIALQRIPVTRVNLLNSAQTAMCALGGVFFFDERLTIWVVTGILLTIAGIWIMERPQRGE